MKRVVLYGGVSAGLFCLGIFFGIQHMHFSSQRSDSLTHMTEGSDFDKLSAVIGDISRAVFDEM